MNSANFFRKIALFQLVALIFFAGALTAFANIPGGGTGTGANVTLTDNGSTVTMANGIVSILCTKSGATINQINYTFNNNGSSQTLNLLSGGNNGGQLYWENGGFGTGSFTETSSVSTPNYAQISLLLTSTTNGTLEVDFSMLRGSPGFYVTAIWAHRSVDAAMGMGETRDNIYSGSIFNWMSVDAARSRLMEVSGGSAIGVQGAPVEVSLWTNGIYSGQYEDKYKYSADFGNQHVYGWSSVGTGEKNVGIWNIQASMEYHQNGPMKRDLMEHIGTTILNMHNSGHYGGGINDCNWGAGEAWAKTYGPYFIYCNNVTNTITGTNAPAQALYNDALAQGLAEQGIDTNGQPTGAVGAWPYYWFTNANYTAASGRGTITGKFTINDTYNPNASASGLWVGVMQQPVTINSTYDFQGWMKNYQFWVKTDTNGNFTIPNVIAGANYTLYAFGPGAAGTFQSQAQTGGNSPNTKDIPVSPFSVTVTAGVTNNLGTVTWTPTRVGATVFEIGYPSRTGQGKFRYGYDYWVSEIYTNPAYPSPIWGKFLEYPFDFPSGPNYVVGQSRWTTDWNYVQPCVVSSTGFYNDSSSTITFNLPSAPSGSASFYIALCSDYQGAVEISVNGTQIAGGNGYSPNYSGSSGECDSTIREGINADFSDARFTVPISDLRSGQNTITVYMRQTGKLSNGDGYFADHAMYDYLRLELSGYVPPAPGSVAAYAGNGCNLISWPVTPGATSYKIFSTTNSGSGYALVASGVTGPVCGSGFNNATWLDTNAVNGATYYYVVQSVNPVGSSANSAQSPGATPSAAISTNAPPAPTGLVVGSVGHHSVALSWNASSSANFYTIQRSTLVDTLGGASNTLGTIILNNTNTGTGYTDVSPTDGSIYSYSVTATSAGGTSGNSTSVVAVPVPAPPATAPGSLTATPSQSTNIVLNWSSVSGAVGYVISRGTSVNGSFTLLQSITETTYTDVGVSSNGTYYYKVTPVNAGGIATNAITTTRPAAPATLSALASNAQATLTWPASIGATGYVVLRGTSTGTVTNIVASGITSTNYTNPGLTNGVTYFYVVESIGTGATSGNSPTASATPPILNLIWSGAASGTWDTSTVNWLNSVTAIAYANGDNVTFNDTTRTNISISGSVSPTSLIFANTNASYTVSATGAGISGATSLIKTNAGTLTLTGGNAYSGGTAVNGGTLLVNNATGSGTGSGNVAVNSGGTLGGNGFTAGSVTVNSGGHTRPGLNGAVNTLNSNLTYNAGAEADFDLSSTYNGANSQMVLNGNTSTLVCGGVTNGINLTGASLDTNHDYVLFNLTGTTPVVSGSFNATPLWLGTTPAVPGIFSIVKTNNTVVLHYAPPVPPAITAASASPNPATRSQLVFVSTTITPGTGAIDPNTGVTVSGGAIAGASAFLVLSNNNVYTNSITVTNTTAAGVQTLTVAVTDSTPSTSTASVSLTLNPVTEIWNGADALNGDTNWNDATNWAGLLFPVAGDSLVFDGPTNLLPDMESSYSIAALTFDNSAGSFNIITTNPAAMLTLAGGVTNNSAGTQTLSVPLMLNAPVTFFAAAGNLTISGGIADAGGGLAVDGGNTVTLAGTNTYTGNTTVNAGKLLVNGSLAGGAVTAASGGALGGTGTINGPAAIQNGGTLSPGTGAIGTLAFGNSLTLADGSTNLFKLNPAPLTNDAVIVTGALTNGGTLLVTNLGAGALAAGNAFQLLNAGNYNGTFANVILPALPVGLAWNTNSLNTAGTLSVVLTTTPVIGSVSISGGGLVFNGTGGVGNANYILLESTNLATPPANWTPLLTNQFDSNGNFILTNPTDPAAPQSFFKLQLQ